MEDKLYIDVIRAGTTYYLNDDSLKDYCIKNIANPYYYKIITLSNGSKITIGYYRQFHHLFVKCSLPKILYGNNIEMLKGADLNKTINCINSVLIELGIFADFSDFTISQIEISNNYICSSEKEKQLYIDLFNKRYVPRKRNSEYDTSTVYKNKSSRSTIYDKSEEVLFRNPDIHLFGKEKRIIRVEHKVPKRRLNKYKKNCKVRDLFNIDLREVLREENKKVGLDMKMLNKKEFYSVLNENIQNKSDKAQKKIIKFYQELNEYGELYVKQRHSKYVFNTYRNIMLRAGICTVHTSSTIKNIVDFQQPEKQTFVQFAKNEIKNIIKKVKGEVKTTKNEKKRFRERMASVKPFCLLRKLFNSISESYFNTS